MSITIRLSKRGKKNAPTYKVVVANTKDKRDGRALDILGHYNPQLTPAEFKIDENKFKSWKDNGALVSPSVQKLVEGTYEFKKYKPGKGETAGA